MHVLHYYEIYQALNGHDVDSGYHFSFVLDMSNNATLALVTKDYRYVLKGSEITDCITP